MLKTQEQWAAILKKLREDSEHVLLSALSNLQVAFTHEQIVITVNNPAVQGLLQNHQSKLPENVVFRKSVKTETKQSLEQKLTKIFGEKLKVE